MREKSYKTNNTQQNRFLGGETKAMKKKLSSLLVFALVLTMLAPAFAFAANTTPSDVVGTEYEDAVNTLGLLGVLTGFPDGTFKPNDGITRAQFAAVVARATGLEQAAQAAKGNATGYTDVPAWHWSSGYVSVASNTGLVNGMGKGLFAPDAPVTFEQAVTMVVRALGYEPKAQEMGGFPVGYLAVANELDLLEDVVQQNTKAPAPRGVVAQIVNNALDKPLMQQVTYGSLSLYEQVPGTSLLKNKLGVQEFKNRVVSNFRVEKALTDNEVRFDDAKGDIHKLVDGLDAEYLLGLEVTAWKKDGKIFKVNVRTGNNNVIYDTVANVSSADVKLKVADATYDITKDSTIFVNNKKNSEIVKDTTYGRFVVDRGEVKFAYLFNFDATGVVKSNKDEVLEYVTNATDAKKVDLKDAKSFNVYNADFSKASLDDVKADTVINIWSADKNHFAVIKNESESGKVVRLKNTAITVDSDEYKYAAKAIYTLDEGETYSVINQERTKDEDALDGVLGKDVKVVFDLNGQVLFVKSSTDAKSKTQYALVTERYANKNVQGVTVFNQDGEYVDYNFANKADAAPFGAVKAWDYADADFAFGIASYKLNVDGELIDVDGFTVTKDVYQVKTIGTKGAGSQVLTADSVKYYITKDTVFMSAFAQNSKKETIFSPVVLSNADIVKMSFAETTKAYIIANDDNDAKFVVFVDAKFAPKSQAKYYGVVTDGVSYDQDRGYITTIDVHGDGKDTYSLDSRTAVNYGDVVEFHIGQKDRIVANVVTAVYNDYTVSGSTSINVNSEVIRVDANAVIYALKGDANSDIDKKIGRGDLDKYSKINYVKDEDGIIVAAVVWGKKGEQVGNDKFVVDFKADKVDAGSATVVLDVTTPGIAKFTVSVTKAGSTQATTFTYFDSEEFTAAELGLNEANTKYLIEVSYDGATNSKVIETN